MIDVEQLGSVTVIRMARALLGRPFYWTAAYWLDGLLIDTGPACTAPELLRVLASRPVTQIVVTHGHEDRIGGLALLHQRYPDAPIYAPRATLPLLADPALLRLQRYRRLLWGAPPPVADAQSLDAINDLVCTPDFTLRVIETPGHTRDHVSYFEPRQRWLFCGDAFIGGRDVAWAPEFDLFAIVSSLRTMGSLRPERLFPGSGTVRRTPVPDIFGKINDLEQLAQQVQRLEANGCSVAEIVQKLFAGEPPLRLWTGGHFSAANLVAACQAYNALLAPEPAAPPATASSRRNRTVS